jgi:hypothetical protein
MDAGGREEVDLFPVRRVQCDAGCFHEDFVVSGCGDCSVGHNLGVLWVVVITAFWRDMLGG